MRIFSNLLPTTFRHSSQPLADFNVQFGKVVAGLLDEEPSQWTNSTQTSALNLSMIINTLICEIDNLEKNQSPTDLVEELLKLIERKIVPNPADKFKGKLDIITNCVVSEGCAVNCEPLLTMRTAPASHLMKSIEDWSNQTLPNFFSPKLQERSPGIEKRRFNKFPSRLLIAPNRIFRNSDWVMEEFSQQGVRAILFCLKSQKFYLFNNSPKLSIHF